MEAKLRISKANRLSKKEIDYQKQKEIQLFEKILNEKFDKPKTKFNKKITKLIQIRQNSTNNDKWLCKLCEEGSEKIIINLIYHDTEIAEELIHKAFIYNREKVMKFILKKIRDKKGLIKQMLLYLEIYINS